MRLYSGQTRAISREMIEDLLENEAVELEEGLEEEARLDLESVLQEYIRVDRELSDEARDIMHERRIGSSSFGRIKRKLARKRNFKLGDESIDWIIDQCIEIMLYSNNVAEVFAIDRDLRIILRKSLRRHSNQETDLDREVRGKLRHLEEGSQSWEVEYEKAMQNLKRHKGMN